MNKTQIFWGCGKLGREVLAFWKKLNMRPDYFCDNADSLWGSEMEGVQILSPQEVYDRKDQATVFVTCGRYEEVRGQLLENGIPEDEIVRADDLRTPEMFYRMSEILSRHVSRDSGAEEERYQCLVDLSGGMVLGGVERWSYSFAGTLGRLNIKSAYILPSACGRETADSTIPAEFVEDNKGIEIIDTMEKILRSGAEVVVCNFPFEIMAGACILKKYINPGLRIIAVLHNDEEIYYRALKTWGSYVDVCLTISTKIKNTLLETGFSSHKIKELYWKIPCNKEHRHSYSPGGRPLRIGFAGRISVKQKRADLLLKTGEELKKRQMGFIMNIVGSGDYEEELKRQIAEKGLADNINFMGEIAHDKIPGFWENQDICISCSEWEGHSISHSEAMAAGAVPVITDTSGARDDVEDGVNGFVADVGDIDTLVNRILYLHAHRELLYEMGNQCIQKILERNRQMGSGDYWRILLDRDSGL